MTKRWGHTPAITTSGKPAAGHLVKDGRTVAIFNSVGAQSVADAVEIETACNTHSQLVAALVLARVALMYSTPKSDSQEAKDRHIGASCAVVEALGAAGVKRFNVYRPATNEDYGTFCGLDESGALDAMALTKGYTSFIAFAAVHGENVSLKITEVK